jgi:protein-S-isoprenylcysteine O-methyltransferase Ste14
MRKRPILPPTYFNIALLVSLGLHFAFPIATIIWLPWSLIGLLPIMFGGVLNLWTDRLFKKVKTTVKPFQPPSVFITEGPFAWCRHPMYFGMVAILLGVSAICGSVASFAGPIAFWLVVRLHFVPAEEESMISIFGDEYRRYRARVRSWI